MYYLRDRRRHWRRPRRTSHSLRLVLGGLIPKRWQALAVDEAQKYIKQQAGRTDAIAQRKGGPGQWRTTRQ